MSGLVPFGGESAWFAVRDRAQAEVVEALGLTDGQVVPVDEAVGAAQAGQTAVLPPLPGVGGRWTLVVGQDAVDPSDRRVSTLSALLATEVQAFWGRHDGSRRCLSADRGTLGPAEDVDGEIGGLAAAWSIDPTRLTGPAPGEAILVGPLRPEAPEPAEPPEMPTPWQRGPWLWRRGRR